MEYIKNFDEYSKLNEAKMTASKIVKVLKNPEDWGDMGDMVHVDKGNFVVVDTWYFGEEKAMQSLKDQWLTPNGTYAKWFNDEYGISFELVDSFSMIKATGRYKKITTDGIVGLKLKIK